MIQLNKTIRELRKKKGLTQEQLAAVLNVSPKTVSKWETGEYAPDLAVIPDLAEFFGVNLDTLFGYSPRKKQQKLEAIFAETRKLFWNDFDRCKAILLTALEEFPSSDALKHSLLSLYECHVRCFGRTDCLEDGIALAREIISSCDDFLIVCDAKDDLAGFLLKKERYDEAREVLLSLPDRAEWSWFSRAFRLRGQDRLDAALPLRLSRIEDLYSACSLAGQGYMEVGNHAEALVCFTEAVQVIELFMKRPDICADAYLWSGMQTHHWSSCLGMAACLYHLGRPEEAGRTVVRSVEILTHAWDEEFAGDREGFLGPFREEFARYGLERFTACPL